MKNVLYCFSGTGNSLATAKDITDGISGTTEIRFMRPYGNNHHDDTDADRTGFIFPVHVWGVPHIVRTYIDTVSISPQTYLFAVATCGGTPGGTMGQLKSTLRKKNRVLSAGFTVRHESGKLGMETPLIAFVRNCAGKPPAYWSERVGEICDTIERKKTGPIEQDNFRTRIIGNLFSSMSAGMIPKLDKQFSVNGACTACGICVRICPAANITLENGTPTWYHQCLQCHACIHWCPQAAIEIGTTSGGKPRYHNPDVTLGELLRTGN